MLVDEEELRKDVVEIVTMVQKEIEKRVETKNQGLDYFSSLYFTVASEIAIRIMAVYSLEIREVMMEKLVETVNDQARNRAGSLGLLEQHRMMEK